LECRVTREADSATGNRGKDGSVGLVVGDAQRDRDAGVDE
jgi:hypothetical protein